MTAVRVAHFSHSAAAVDAHVVVVVDVAVVAVDVVVDAAVATLVALVVHSAVVFSSPRYQAAVGAK